MSNEIQQKLRAAIRQVWSRYSQERRQVLADAKRYHKAINKDGSIGKVPRVSYVCSVCLKEVKATEIEVDHNTPVGRTPSFPPNPDDLSWDTWLTYLFCPIENLRAICKTCHRVKSGNERKKNGKDIRKKRRLFRTAKKGKRRIRRRANNRPSSRY